VRAATGGGGGGGGRNRWGGGGAGDAAPLGDLAADGGTGINAGCTTHGYTNGGWGGDGAHGEEDGGAGGPTDWVSGCSGGTLYVGAGGGGGGGGRIRVNTASGCQCGGVFSPPPEIGELTTR
jgi:hypothetical protein